jgi:N-dimethylarginine dimethylaminohydrolase
VANGLGFGGHSMYGALRRVLVRPPCAEFGAADPDVWHYRRRPDLAVARAEHAGLVRLLRESAVEVIVHDAPDTRSADAMFVHDSSLVTDAGAILLGMGKDLRRDEPAAAGAALRAAGVPILATLDGTARAEGGDLLWIDERTLVAGVGVRTNGEGVRRIAEALGPLGVRVAAVPLPRPSDPRACLHLMSSVSVLDRDLAVVDRRSVPGALLDLLAERGFALVEAAPGEFDSMAPNVLAVGPRDCIALEGSAETERRLASAGCRVRTYRGREISWNAEGGPTCLTRPVERERAARFAPVRV